MQSDCTEDVLRRDLVNNIQSKILKTDGMNQEIPTYIHLTKFHIFRQNENDTRKKLGTSERNNRNGKNLGK